MTRQELKVHQRDQADRALRAFPQDEPLRALVRCRQYEAVDAQWSLLSEHRQLQERTQEQKGIEKECLRKIADLEKKVAQRANHLTRLHRQVKAQEAEIARLKGQPPKKELLP